MIFGPCLKYTPSGTADAFITNPNKNIKLKACIIPSLTGAFLDLGGNLDV